MAAQALRAAAADAEVLAACEEAARDAVADARGGALVRGAGGSCSRFTTGFGISFSIFFGFGGGAQRLRGQACELEQTLSGSGACQG